MNWEVSELPEHRFSIPGSAPIFMVTESGVCR